MSIWFFFIFMYIESHLDMDQLNTHLKIRTHFPHEILPTCRNIKWNSLTFSIEIAILIHLWSIELKDFDYVSVCVCVFGIDSFSESHILFEHYTFYIVFSNISHLLLPLKFDEFISESGSTTVEMWKSIFKKRFVLTQIHLYSIHFCNVLCYMFCGQFQK